MSEINLDILENSNILLSIEDSGALLPYYEGDYDVVPKVKSQKLETKNKSMSNDVNIAKIPYEEVHNLKGTTVTIGGIL